jgi:plastocyanin
VLTVAGTTTKPTRTVDLRWTGATGSTVTINRNGSAIAQTANDGQFTNTLSAKGTYRYTVCEPQPLRCSNEVAVRFTK